MKKILLLLIVLVITAFSLVSCTLLSFVRGNTDSTEDVTTAEDSSNIAYKREEKNFDDIDYKRPDFEAIAKIIDETSAMVDNGDSSIKIYTQISKIFYEVADVQTQTELLTLYQSRDVTNDTYSDELLLLTEKSTELDEKYYKLLLKIIESDYKDSVLEDFTEQDIEFIKVIASAIDDEYKELNTRKTALISDYKEKSTAIHVKVNGKELSIDEIAQEYQNGKITYNDYIGYYNQYLKAMNEAVGNIFVEIVSINKQIAEKTGEPSYADYAYKYEYHRDYTPEDSQKMADYVKRYIIPAYNDASMKITQTDYKNLNDIYSRSVSYSNSLYMNRLKKMFTDISPDMAEAYSYMMHYNLYDIDARDTKQDYSFTTYFMSLDLPFLYISPDGGFDDLITFAHEFGHFFAFYENGADTPSQLDINEIYSQVNEFFALDYCYLNDAQKKSYVKSKLLENLGVMIQGCMFDSFLQELYSGDYTTLYSVNKLFKQVASEFGYNSDETGTDVQYIWSLVPHNFEYPFYYISYATSLIPTLDVYGTMCNDRDAAIEKYLDLIHVDSTKSFLEVLEENEIGSPFDEQTYKDLVEFISKQFS